MVGKKLRDGTQQSKWADKPVTRAQSQLRALTLLFFVECSMFPDLNGCET